MNAPRRKRKHARQAIANPRSAKFEVAPLTIQQAAGRNLRASKREETAMLATKTIRLQDVQDEQMSLRASVALWVGLAILGWLPIAALVSAVA